MRPSKFELFMQYHFFIRTRRFIKNTYRKYFLWYDYWNEKKLDDRRVRQNKHFKWTEQKVIKMIDLNEYLKKLQELLGHSDAKTTMIYAHVLNKGPSGVISPLNRM